MVEAKTKVRYTYISEKVTVGFAGKKFAKKKKR